MDTAAIYHRPESEYAFLYTADTFRIRLRTCKDDVKKVLENFSKPEENNIYKPAQSSNTIYNYTSDEHELLLAINNNNELVGFKYIEKEAFYK